MFETLLAIIGICLGFIVTVMAILGDNVVLIFVIWWVIQLVKWIKDKNRKGDGK